MPIAEKRLEKLQICKLLQCVREKDMVQIQKLINHGVPHLINFNDANEGFTALGVAAAANDDEMIQFLMGIGAHPDAVDLKGRTASMRAAEFGHVQCLEQLVANEERKAKMDIKDLEGKGMHHQYYFAVQNLKIFFKNEYDNNYVYTFVYLFLLILTNPS